ncbi:MAG TPA: arginine--tRNA ligase [Polyangiaceae bacterium]
MADPTRELVPLFQAAVAKAFGPEHAQIDPMLRASKHADYQANLAMSLAKSLGRPPREVATAIVAALLDASTTSGDDAGPHQLSWIARAEVAGPGFINVWVSNRRLGRALDEFLVGDLGLRSRPAERVVIDYSSPNVAKEMHVGHLRSTIIGDALARVFDALGHVVIRQNHVGDWGTPFGMLIEHLLDVGAASEVRGADANEHTIGDLGAFYQAARQKFDSDPAFAERARSRVVELQAGDATTLELWRKLVAASRRYFTTIYELLGVTLTDSDIAGESLYNPWLSGVVESLRQSGHAVESDGAICIFPPGFSGRDEQPLPLIIRKQDGGYGYATTDMAAIRYRCQTLKADRILYVVGAPQAQHLAMVFAAAKSVGWLPGHVAALHVPFGSVLGADKKIFRTRAGETVRLVDLLNETITRALAVVTEKNASLPSEQQETIARMVGIGAVKYADLSNDRVKDYVFDWDRMLSFDGNTAPYLQYALARIRSIFRRGEGTSTSGAIEIGVAEEKQLAMLLLTYPTVVQEVADSLAPHKLCGYLFELATGFSHFYEACPVLKAADAAERSSRLRLCEVTARVLEHGLQLLGIQAPDRM